MIQPVILSGGVGSRLWPVSRETLPKQLNVLHGDLTMVQATARRAAAIGDAAPPIIVCGAAHVDEIEHQLTAVGHPPQLSIVEPVGRNTAPAIGAVAGVVQPDTVLLVLPADHVIGDTMAFASTVTAAVPAARAGRVVTFGVRPAGPATGYGYIEHGSRLELGGVDAVARFVEKPDVATAREFVASDRFSWNAGMFLVTAGTYLDELRRHRPDIADGVAAALGSAGRDGRRVVLGAEEFAACPSDSIDYAVMERTDRAAVARLDTEWSDVGSWAALWDIVEKDGAGNAVAGPAFLESVANSLVRAGDRPVAVVGLEGVVVVDTGDAVLVAALDDAQEVKAIVERLKDAGRPEV